ncbi:glycosyltransferase family 2 protein, partial [Flavobacterium psychrophilum]
IMQLMQLKEYKKHTFKILPQTTDYLIGSNSSNDRGGVILMSDFKN